MVGIAGWDHLKIHSTMPVCSMGTIRRWVPANLIEPDDGGADFGVCSLYYTLVVNPCMAFRGRLDFVPELGQMLTEMCSR